MQDGTKTRTNRQVQHVEPHAEHPKNRQHAEPRVVHLTSRKRNRQHVEQHVEHPKNQRHAERHVVHLTSNQEIERKEERIQ